MPDFYTAEGIWVALFLINMVMVTAALWACTWINFKLMGFEND